MALECFLNFLWLCDFLINLNRVNFHLKVITFRETSRQYLHSTGVPDFVALVGAISSVLSGHIYTAKCFDLIRLLRSSDVLYPVRLLVNRYTTSGKRRIAQIN